MRTNLFSTWFNVLLTLLALWLVYVLVPPFVQWAFIDADWAGDTREACAREGACWVFIKVWFWQFIYGFYPVDSRWRVDLGFFILVVATIPLFLPRFKHKHWVGLFLLVAGAGRSGCLPGWYDCVISAIAQRSTSAIILLYQFMINEMVRLIVR